MSNWKNEIVITYNENTPMFLEILVGAGLDIATLGVVDFQESVGKGWFCTIFYERAEIKVIRYGETKEEAYKSAFDDIEEEIQEHENLIESQRRAQLAKAQREARSEQGSGLQSMSSSDYDPSGVMIVLKLMGAFAVLAAIYYVVKFILVVLLPIMLMASPLGLVTWAWFRRSTSRTWFAAGALVAALVIVLEHYAEGIISRPFSEMGPGFERLAYFLFVSAVLAGTNALGFLVHDLILAKSSINDPTRLQKQRMWLIASMALLAGIVILLDYLLSDKSQRHAVAQDETDQSSSQNTSGVLNDGLEGNSKGKAFDVQYVAARNGTGAKFSLGTSSRIEYSVPAEGTIMLWINVEEGYNYRKGIMTRNQNDVEVFTTTGPDVWYPGSTWWSLNSSGDITLNMSTGFGNPNASIVTSAKGTGFGFNRWHHIGISYGSKGQFLFLDGNIVASNAGLTQRLGLGGNKTNQCDRATIGSLKSCFWGDKEYEGGFVGIVDDVKISSSQLDW